LKFSYQQPALLFKVEQLPTNGIAWRCRRSSGGKYVAVFPRSTPYESSFDLDVHQLGCRGEEEKKITWHSHASEGAMNTNLSLLFFLVLSYFYRIYLNLYCCRIRTPEHKGLAITDAVLLLRTTLRTKEMPEADKRARQAAKEKGEKAAQAKAKKAEERAKAQVVKEEKAQEKAHKAAIDAAAEKERKVSVPRDQKGATHWSQEQHFGKLQDAQK